jgi:hypothetical protein
LRAAVWLTAEVGKIGHAAEATVNNERNKRGQKLRMGKQCSRGNFGSRVWI